MGKGQETLYLPPLGLLETLAGVFPEQAMAQRDQLATVFQAAKVRLRFSVSFLDLFFLYLVCFGSCFCLFVSLVWLVLVLVRLRFGSKSVFFCGFHVAWGLCFERHV